MNIQSYSRMSGILNGIILSNMAGGAVFCAISVQQTQAVDYFYELVF